jgi:hypothetical protein
LGNLDFIFDFSGVIDPAETAFDDFRSDFLGEFEAICETGLAYYQRPTYMGLIDEKPRVENLVSLSLKPQTTILVILYSVLYPVIIQ